MTDHSEPWDEFDFISTGRFSRPKDLSDAVDRLWATTNSPVLLLTFSPYYLLPSLSAVRVGGDDALIARATHGLAMLRATAESTLRDVSDPIGHMSEQGRELLRTLGVENPDARAFGALGEQRQGSGRLGVVVATAQVEPDPDVIEDVRVEARRIAGCVFTSRAATFHRENSQDSVVRRNYEAANELIASLEDLDPSRNDTSLGDLGDIASQMSRVRLRSMHQGAHTVLDIDAIGVYERKGETLVRVVPERAEYPLDFPEVVVIDYDQQMPDAPELGGSSFESIAGPLNLSFARQSKLFTDIADDWHAITWPFGGTSRVAGFGGVVIMLWRDRHVSPLGAYEVSQVNSIVRRIERELVDGARSESLGRLGAVLGQISRDRQPPEAEVQDIRRGRLLRRRDIAKALPAIDSTLKFLVDYTQSLSATCRILTGDVGEVFDRSLYRVSVFPEAEGIKSPERIPLHDVASSVNAWTAVNGRPVYLSAIHHIEATDEAPAKAEIPDLGLYAGLEAPAVYREMRSELCVPIFAEGRLVGTINLESAHPRAYDSTAEVASESANTIGVALLTSRRSIGAELIMDAGGFLDRRHELDRLLHVLREEIRTGNSADSPKLGEWERQVDSILHYIYLQPRLAIADEETNPTVGTTLLEALVHTKWSDTSGGTDELLRFLDPDAGEGAKTEFESCLRASIGREQATALKFALIQALGNVRVHSRGAKPAKPWAQEIRLRLHQRTIGGVVNVYVALRSLASLRRLNALDVDKVYREPIMIQDDERTRMGAYIAGEVLRRCGGSAFMRVDTYEDVLAVVTGEFGVPLS